MNKNRFAVIMVIVFIVVILTFGWFFLQHVMDKYDVDKKDWDETNTSMLDNHSTNNHYLYS